VGLTVAVTGPTGELGISVVSALERDPAVDAVVGMARRPFDPASLGWAKTVYRRGDVLDRAAVDSLLAEVDVVVHLAFVVFGSHSESARVNLDGCRTVFEAAVAAPRLRRLVFTSSVAAYGYHPDTPVPIVETTPARGSAEHYYSAQKAACEQALTEVTAGTGLEVYVLRPCIVAGPRATQIVRLLPWRLAAARFDGPLRAVPGSGVLRPVLPDPGGTLQLVHHDDVADAVLASVLGAGPPGAYNIAGSGTITVGDYARAVGAVPVPVPHAVLGLASRLLAVAPLAPAWAEWLHTLRVPMAMDTRKARQLLGWTPRYSAAQTLAATVAAPIAPGQTGSSAIAAGRCPAEFS
jgi:UDP-glucose 4-epimerase